jgi:hydroxyacylglutathione hydrolase
MALQHRSLSLGPLDNNSYLLWCDVTRAAAVVDVGFEPERMIAAVREAALEPRLLLATHAHYDHVAGMRAVQDAVGGAFHLHPADRPLLDHLSEQGAMFGLPPSMAPGTVHDLADGQTLTLGQETLEVIHVPGHSPGHVAFRHGDDLWAGDVLFAGSIGRTDLPGGSFETLERSIRQRLFPLGDAVRVWTGHGPPTTLGAERRHNPFVGEKANFA